MAINYDFYKSGGIFAAEEQWHVRLVENGTTETAEIMEHIERATSLTVADLKGAIEALAGQIADNLAGGRSVHIDGLGHFSLSIGGEVVQDEEGKLRLKHAAVRSVNFRPEAALMRRLDGATFTVKQHRGRRSADVDETTLPTTLAALCRERGHFTVNAFRQTLGLTRTTAHRLLHRLCDEDRIENIGSPRFALYRLKSEAE